MATPAPRRAPFPPLKSRCGTSWANITARRSIICWAARRATKSPLTIPASASALARITPLGTKTPARWRRACSFDQFSERSFGQRITRAEIEKGLVPIKQIRDAVGDRVDIGIECHFRWNRVSMERIARALEPYDILFLEDVLPPVYPDEIKALAQKTSIPIIGSELLLTRWQYREWLEKQVCQILMTDAVWNGGIAETRKIANLAETFGVPLVLHNIAGAICHAACMHLGAHIPNLYYVESVRAFYKEYFDVLTDFRPTVSDGHLDIPAGPGLGVNLRDSALQRDDLIRAVSDGEGLARGRRAMGDHWAVEEIR
ncbi:MAG: mandelate racemase/muconate lactonizing enzyme family protein [Anaerolineae bacterium]|nr:mandelate racemase/muconate lactonizing enzyme family protein [Anaerolineae bacterium]